MRRAAHEGLKRITRLSDEYFPKIIDRDLLDDLISVSDEYAFRAGIQVARTDGEAGEIAVGADAETGAPVAPPASGGSPRTPMPRNPRWTTSNSCWIGSIT